MEFQSYEDWKDKLISYGNQEGIVILVEGKNDEIKLKKIGISNTLSLKGKKFYDILEEVENCKEVVLLFDLDKQGEKIFNKFFQLLQREGIPVNTAFREYLKNFDLKEIEKIPLEKEPVPRNLSDKRGI
ncbi:toprim domain-containing protein [Persephonella sp.]